MPNDEASELGGLPVPAELEPFLARHGTQLLRLAVLMSGSVDAGQDLYQDTVERTLRKWPRISTMDEPLRYVQRMIINRSIDTSRSTLSRRRAESRAGDRAIADVSDQVAARATVLGALQQLPRRQRAAIVLRYWQDLPERAIAEELGCPIGTVKSLISRAMHSLRADLDSGGTS